MEWMPQDRSYLPSSEHQQLAIGWSRPMHGSGDIFVPCSFAQSYLNRSWIIAGKLGGMEGWGGWSWRWSDVIAPTANTIFNIDHKTFTKLTGGHNIDLDVIYKFVRLMATTWLTLGYLLAITRISINFRVLSRLVPPGGQKVKPSPTSGGTTQKPRATLT